MKTAPSFRARAHSDSGTALRRDYAPRKQPLPKLPRVTALRDHGLRIGELEPGLRNAITDVLGVAVGHVTVRRGEAPPPAGRGVARTGVTAIVPAPPETLVTRP